MVKIVWLTIKKSINKTVAKQQLRMIFCFMTHQYSLLMLLLLLYYHYCYYY